MCLCESHSTSRVAVLEPALPSCLHCLPEASAPALPSRHSWQKASRSDSQSCISSFLLLPLAPSPHYTPHPNTIPSLKFRPGFLTLQHRPSDLQVTLLSQPRRIASNCKRWREQCSQSAGHSKPAVPQHRAQLHTPLLRSRSCHCCSMSSSNQDASCRTARCH